MWAASNGGTSSPYQIGARLEGQGDGENVQITAIPHKKVGGIKWNAW